MPRPWPRPPRPRPPWHCLPRTHPIPCTSCLKYWIIRAVFYPTTYFLCCSLCSLPSHRTLPVGYSLCSPPSHHTLPVGCSLCSPPSHHTLRLCWTTTPATLRRRRRRCVTRRTTAIRGPVSRRPRRVRAARGGSANAGTAAAAAVWAAMWALVAKTASAATTHSVSHRERDREIDRQRETERETERENAHLLDLKWYKIINSPSCIIRAILQYFSQKW